MNFSINKDIYLLVSNLKLSIENTAEYNNKILLSRTEMKICSLKNINKTEARCRSLVMMSEKYSLKHTDSESIIVQPVAQQSKPRLYYPRKPKNLCWSSTMIKKK